MEGLKIVIGVVVYTVVIVLVYLPIWRFIGKYPLRYLNKVLQKAFVFNARKSEMLLKVTEYIWCTTLLIWMSYFITPFIRNIILGSELTVLFSYSKYSILLYALISMLKVRTPSIIESNVRLSSMLRFMSFSSALLIQWLS